LQEESLKLEEEIDLRKPFRAGIDASLRRPAMGALIVAVLLTIFLGLSSLRTTRLAADEADLIVHTYAVMDTLELTSRHLTEAEGGTLAFALGGRETLLPPFAAWKSTIMLDEGRLRNLTEDNPSQQRRLDVLEPQVRATLKLTESILAKRQQLKVGADASDFLTAGKLTDAARATTREMKAEENRLLGQRSQRTEAKRQWSSRILFVGIFTGVGLLTLAWLAVNHAIGASAQWQTQISTLNAELTQRVEQRTWALQSEIGEHKQVQERVMIQAAELARSLQELEAQAVMLQSVLDGISEGVVAADEQGRLVLWNPAAKKIIGLGAANVSSEEWTEHYGLFLPDTVTPFPADQNPLTRAICGETSTAEMFVHNPALGEGVWIEASATPLKNKRGVACGGVVALRDITQSRAHEHEIRKLNEVLEDRVLERTTQLEGANKDLADQKFALDQHAIVAVTDVQGTITYVNDKFCAISKYSKAELIGQNHRILNSRHHPVEFFQQMYQVIAKGKVWHGEIKNRAKDGSIYWVDTTIVPTLSTKGNPDQYVAIRADITERKQAEERVRQRTAELEIANKELESFSYSVSHDLRAPLRHIVGFSKMLAEEFGSTLEPTAQHYLDHIQSGTEKMGLLVDELLNLARVGQQVLRRQPTGLNSLVGEVIAILQPESEGRQVEWVIADLPSLECDPVLVRQVFQNLLANALKFTRPRKGADSGAHAGESASALHTVIEVGCKEQDGQSVFMVRDNGAGFSMKYVDRLFGAFQRLHRADEFEGTGIGLATVQRIVHKHGGRVWAQSELDKGAAFYFTLGVGEPVGSKSRRATAGGYL
jgi:PAS domain S-box-containing protein